MAAIDISHLNTEERLELLGELWDSLSVSPDTVPLRMADREELDRRLTAFERDRREGKSLGSSAEEVLERVRASSK